MQAANQRAAETETLLQASHVVAASLDMDNTIRQILLQLEQVVPYRTASVQILKDGALEIVGGRGWDEAEAVLGLQFPVPGDNPNSKVIESRQPYILDDAPAVFEAFRQPPHDHIRSLLGVPLIIGDELIGMLSIDHSQPGFYDQSHARLAQAFADQVAVAIQNASHFQAEQRRRQLAAMLQDITQITSASLELDEVVQRVASLTCQAMELDLVIVLLRPSPAEPLELTELHACHLDLPQPQLEELKRQLSLNLPADKLLQLAPGFSPSLLQADNLPPEAPDRMRQWIEQGQALLVPLIAAGHSTGLMLLLRLSPSPPFNSQAADMALTIGQSVAASLDNAKLYAQMERMAITDSLTNLYNRRGLTQLGQREIERARRFDRSFSVLMLDLDHFKQLNDSYGHPAGDEVLHQLADLLGQLVRSIDVVARYGGEEFALLLPECHFDCAQVVAERLRQAIASTSFSTSAGDLNLTISLGIASGSNLPLELESLLEAADRALYAAKEAGRNQSWAWHPQGPRPALP
jgi:diguanylate cyclase (GGDEF)-like protein